jgi:hypothetical protein
VISLFQRFFLSGGAVGVLSNPRLGIVYSPRQRDVCSIVGCGATAVKMKRFALAWGNNIPLRQFVSLDHGR